MTRKKTIKSLIVMVMALATLASTGIMTAFAADDDVVLYLGENEALYTVLTDLQGAGGPYGEDDDNNIVTFTQEAAGNVTFLTLNYPSFINLDGIDELKKLPNLDILTITGTDITEFNLSGFDNLTNLVIEDNTGDITSIQLSDMPKLTTIDLSDGGTTIIGSLSIDNMPVLDTLYTANCKITNVSLTNLGALTGFMHTDAGIEDLTVTNIPNLTNLDVSDNQISELSLADLPELTNLNLSSNMLTTLSLSDYEKLEQLGIVYNKITDVTLSNMPVLQTFEFSDNLISTMTLTDLDALEMLNFSIFGWGKDVSLTLDSMASLETLNIGSETTHLKLANLDKITKISSLHGNALKEVEIENLPALEEVAIVNNDLISFNISGTDNLTSLSLPYNELETIEIKDLPALTELNLAGNALQDVSLLGLPALTSLILAENTLEDVSLPELPLLETLNLSNNVLDDIDLNSFSNHSLKELDLSNNSLQSVDLTMFDDITTLNISNNEFSSVDLPDFATLRSVNINNNQIKNLDDINVTFGTDVDGSAYTNRTLSVSFNKIEDISELGEFYTDCEADFVTLRGNEILEVQYIEEVYKALDDVSKIPLWSESDGWAWLINESSAKDILSLDQQKATLYTATTENIPLPQYITNTLNPDSLFYISNGIPPLATNGTISDDYTTFSITDPNEVATILIGGQFMVGSNRITIELDQIFNPVELSKSHTELSNQDVTVTITADEPLQSISGWDLSADEMSLTKVYTENTTEVVTVYDRLGNDQQVTVTIDNIDKATNIPQVSYSTTEPTNQSVMVTIIADEKLQPVSGWNLSADEMSLTKEYTANITENITIYDLFGNAQTLTISITNIDTEMPVLNTAYNPVTPSNAAVEVTITADEKLQPVSGWELSADEMSLTKVYAHNTTEVVTVLDKAGNSQQVTVTVTVDTLNALNVSYSTTQPTKQSVVVTITGEEKLLQISGWELSSDEHSLTKEYTANTTENITVYDILGNTQIVIISIENIDTVAPTLDVTYDLASPSNATMEVTITADEKIQSVSGWELSANEMSLSKVYSRNTTQRVTVRDLAGNSQTASIVVTGIVSDGTSDPDQDDSNTEELAPNDVNSGNISDSIEQSLDALDTDNSETLPEGTTAIINPTTGELEAVSIDVVIAGRLTVPTMEQLSEAYGIFLTTRFGNLARDIEVSLEGGFAYTPELNRLYYPFEFTNTAPNFQTAIKKLSVDEDEAESFHIGGVNSVVLPTNTTFVCETDFKNGTVVTIYRYNSTTDTLVTVATATVENGEFIFSTKTLDEFIIVAN